MPAPTYAIASPAVRAASCSALRVSSDEPRGGRLLDDLLVPTLQRAVALADDQDGAVGVADDLHLDVPAVLDVRLAEDGRVAERARRLVARELDGASRARPASRTTRMPRPPPPLLALTSTGRSAAR